MLTKETIQHNIDCFQKQMSKLVDFSDGKALMVNNADWLLNLNYIEFLREVGVHFSVNRMLAAECYKQRLERGLSFFELNYMICLLYTSNGCRILGIYEFAQDEIRKFHFDPPFFVNGIKGEACQSSSCSIAVI